MNQKIDLRRFAGAALGGALLAGTAVAGCGGGEMTPQLRDARAVMEEARSGSAARLKPEGLLVAQRTLSAAERAPDGSRTEAHYAYVAERQTRIAMAEARQIELEQTMERERQQYGTQLEEIARQRGQTLQERERALEEQRRAYEQQQSVLAEQEATLAEQQQALQRTQQELQTEQQARMDAEQRAQESMDRLRELAAVRQERGETVITLSGEVIFESDSARLADGARERLLALADALRAGPDQTAVIEGHTDSRGSSEYNRRLSARRAEAVRDFLIAEGVPAARLQAVGRGEDHPLTGNDTAEGRANNRRVEVHLRPAAAGSEGARGGTR